MGVEILSERIQDNYRIQVIFSREQTISTQLFALSHSFISGLVISACKASMSVTFMNIAVLCSLIWGWRSCVVYTNEVISEIWRTNYVMSSLRSSGLYSLWHQSGCPTLPLPSLPTDLSNTTTRQRSSPQATGLSALSSLSRRDGVASYWQIPQHPL